MLSDAIKNEHDNEDFINKFQCLKKDGHVRMYTRQELVSLLNKHHFHEVESFESQITFSRELNSQYLRLLDVTSLKTKNCYSVAVIDNKITLTFDIINIAFELKS